MKTFLAVVIYTAPAPQIGLPEGPPEVRWGPEPVVVLDTDAAVAAVRVRTIAMALAERAKTLEGLNLTRCVVRTTELT